MNKYTSKSHDLIERGPQGLLIWQLLYIIDSDDIADEVSPEDKYKNIDDLVVLDSVKIEDKLVDYNVLQHVPSDVPTGEIFFYKVTHLNLQNISNSISKCTKENKMVINKRNGYNQVQ